MRGPDAVQLAALELRLCDLAHPDRTLRMGPVDADFDPSKDGDRRPLALSTALSRWLIDHHALARLTPESFSRSWSYAVLGGHRATRSLREQVLAYLAATWVRRAVSGAQARGLHHALGAAAFDEALQRTAPLEAWRAPRSMPEAPLEFLRTESHRFLAALWERDAPALAAWAAVMSPVSSAVDIDLGVAVEGCAPSRPLLDELDARLQEDFAIDLETDEAGA